jgi:hypothetical protein
VLGNEEVTETAEEKAWWMAFRATKRELSVEVDDGDKATLAGARRGLRVGVKITDELELSVRIRRRGRSDGSRGTWWISS